MNSYEKHTSYIKKQEYEVVDKLLDDPAALNDISRLGNFAEAAYNRVQDIFDFSDFDKCRVLIMVGCGPFPMTSLHIINRHPNITVNALDIDNDALESAKRLVSGLGLSQSIKLHHSDGLQFDYSEADIVYVANLVRPKKSVLQQIHRCCKKGTLIVLRDPTTEGEGYAESGLSTVSDEFVVEKVGAGDASFHSRHVFLRCQ